MYFAPRIGSKDVSHDRIDWCMIEGFTSIPGTTKRRLVTMDMCSRSGSVSRHRIWSNGLRTAFR